MNIESMPQHPVGQQEQLTFDQKLEKAARLIFKKLQMDPIVKGEYGDKYFSGDAASLYTLILGEEGSKRLLKIGWGEVSQETFVGSIKDLIERQLSAFSDDVKQHSINRVQTLRDLPAPVYCVRQDKSYFANDKLKQQMIDNPEQYLQEQALFVNDKGVFRGRDSQLWPGNSERNQAEGLPVGNIDNLIQYLENLPSFSGRSTSLEVVETKSINGMRSILEAINKLGRYGDYYANFLPTLIQRAEQELHLEKKALRQYASFHVAIASTPPDDIKHKELNPDDKVDQFIYDEIADYYHRAKSAANPKS